MGRMLAIHVDAVLKKMAARGDVDLLEVDYNAMVSGDTSIVARINEFLGGRLDTKAMSAVVDKNLYRQRKS
jgi:hypothetical protein